MQKTKNTDLTFTVLPRLKWLDFIFGLQTMKLMNVSIHPFDSLMLIGNQPFSLRVKTTTGILLVGWFIQNYPIILTKVARNKCT